MQREGQQTSGPGESSASLLLVLSPVQQHQHNPREAPLVRTTPGCPPPQPLSRVPTCLLDVGHPGGHGSAVAEPTDVLREHSEGVGVADYQVGDGAAGAGAALQHCEPLLQGKKGEKRGQ